ncbi:MAG: TonB-dependent copper receptor [Shewanella sp.]|nr:TonB-dependent copper receptor [Shewanella sp.]MCF1429593.1 TonB-dependent copper receptor [Shewanella sp.]MCF1437975.1 TonB-dependent copper receptor [Shewanella sp.]MCF1458372.1 TonB-dependent copper receptor [Shewanella sp.]
MKHNKLLLALLMTGGFVAQARAEDVPACEKAQGCDERIVVTGELMRKPLSVVTDPKKPRLPLPAYDGAGFLKTIPGFSISRKGGAGGDPSLRGLGGSRINIVNDGQHVYGTCGGRMDPPTAYIYPESYDSIEVIKGPQTVRHGPVGSAGTVLFEKDRQRFVEQDATGRASVTAGSYERLDYIVELAAGDENHYLELDANQSSSDHYEDGNGNPIQSSYDRRNMDFALGWTPGDDTVLELSYGKSDGEAEYADRANKARVIENQNFTLIGEHDFNGDYLQSIEFQAYHNDNDHVMDQFDQGGNFGTNVRRRTQGGHIWAEWNIGKLTMVTGADMQDSVHKGRTVGNVNDPYNPAFPGDLDVLLGKPFKDNMSYTQFGVFGEFEYDFEPVVLFTGIRYDYWDTELHVAQKGERQDDLVSGFARIEHEFGGNQYYLGVGYAQRIPDYWEIMKASAADASQKAFDLEPEKTSQLDAGWIYDMDAITLSSALYYGEIKDYILIDNRLKVDGKVVSRSRNIDATIWGGELGAEWRITESLQTQLSLVYAHGENDTDNEALGQVSPLEGRLTVDYRIGDWTLGLLWRVVDSQDRVAKGQGNISGQDLGESAGFGTLAFNAGWKHGEHMRLTMGVENLFDRTYAEHISRSGAGNDVPGSVPTFQVNEPGRNAWVKLEYLF